MFRSSAPAGGGAAPSGAILSFSNMQNPGFPVNRREFIAAVAATASGGAPFIIGVILGKIAEDSLQKAIAIFGANFFLRPISLILIACILASIGFYMWRQRHPTKASVPSHA